MPQSMVLKAPHEHNYTKISLIPLCPFSFTFCLKVHLLTSKCLINMERSRGHAIHHLLLVTSVLVVNIKLIRRVDIHGVTDSIPASAGPIRQLLVWAGTDGDFSPQ